VLLKTRFILLALTRWNLNRFWQFFHSWKKNIIKNYNKLFESVCFLRENVSGAVRVSQLLRISPFEAFQLQIFFMMQTTDALEMPVPVIFHRLCAVSSGLVFLTENHIVNPVNVFIHARTSLSAAALTSVHCACVSELLEQSINATFRPSFFSGNSVNCLALYLFNW